MTDHLSRAVDRRGFLLQTVAATAGTIGLGATVRGGSALGYVTPQEEATAFLASYVEGFLPLRTAAEEASWIASTDVSETHTAAQVAANQKVNEFIGSPRAIEMITRLLGQKDQLDELTVRQLEKARLRAAEAPGTIPEVVKARTENEARQGAAQDGFVYTLKRDGKPDEHPSANDIDRVLVSSKDLAERRAVWEISKTIGSPLRDGILRLRDLRNRVAREMGFDDFFALQIADYGMTVPEMIALCDKLVAEVNPLYTQLHTWAKHALAKR
jgi:peptidyl-dipeptidase A